MRSSKRDRVASAVILIVGIVFFVTALMVVPINPVQMGFSVSGICCSMVLAREEEQSELDEAVRQQRLAITQQIWRESQRAALELMRG